MVTTGRGTSKKVRSKSPRSLLLTERHPSGGDLSGVRVPRRYLQQARSNFTAELLRAARTWLPAPPTSASSLSAGTHAPARKPQRMAPSASGERIQHSFGTGHVVPAGGSEGCSGFSFAILCCFPGKLSTRRSIGLASDFPSVGTHCDRLAAPRNAPAITRGCALGDRLSSWRVRGCPLR
jgi:hypothetical protein